MRQLSSLDDARARDAADPLRMLRAEFAFPRRDGHPTAYFCGHSLGLPSHRSRSAVVSQLDAWAELGVDGHFAGAMPWYRADDAPAASLARLIGARPDEVAVANGLTVNLHLLMASFFRPSGTRRKILIEASAFPSDRYAVAAQLAWHGLDPAADLVVAPAGIDGRVTTEALCDAIADHGESLALVLVGGVHYLTGELVDLAAIAAAGHAVGAVVGADLAHAAGNVPLTLHDDGVDFAAWCTYKYLNAGAGAVAGFFVHARHGDDPDLVRLAGWWGNDPDTRFAMHEQVDFVPASGARSWKVSNPPILSVASLVGSLEVFELAGMARLRSRSIELTATLEAQLAEVAGLEQVTPADPARRGAMLTLRVAGPVAGAAVVTELAAAGVVVDFRPPDVLRISPVPLYTSYEDIWRVSGALVRVLGRRG